MNTVKSQNSSDLDSNNSKNIVILGEIVSVFGVKGYCKINSFTDPKSNLVKYFKSGIDFLWRSNRMISGFDVTKNWSTMPIEDIKSHAESKVIVKLENCNDRDLAEKLKGVEIAVSRSDLTKFSQKNEHFWHDLENLSVFNADDVKLGTVSHLISTGANDVLVVKNTEADKEKCKDKEYLIPFVLEQYVLEVDYDNQKIIVDWDLDF